MKRKRTSEKKKKDDKVEFPPDVLEKKLKSAKLVNDITPTASAYLSGVLKTLSEEIISKIVETHKSKGNDRLVVDPNKILSVLSQNKELQELFRNSKTTNTSIGSTWCIDGNIQSGKTNLFKFIQDYMGKRVETIRIKYKSIQYDDEFTELWTKNPQQYSFTLCSIYLTVLINQVIKKYNNKTVYLFDGSHLYIWAFILLQYEMNLITYEQFTFLKTYWKNKILQNQLPNLIIYIDIDPLVCYSRQMISECKVKYSKQFYSNLDVVFFRLILSRLMKEEDTLVVSDTVDIPCLIYKLNTKTYKSSKVSVQINCNPPSEGCIVYNLLTKLDSALSGLNNDVFRESKIVYVHIPLYNEYNAMFRRVIFRHLQLGDEIIFYTETSILVNPQIEFLLNNDLIV